MFPCKRCAICCKSLKRSSLYRDLDRGDGVCRHLNEATKLCRIYDKRPLKCNIDLAYEKIYRKKFTREQFYLLNMTACRLLEDEKHVLKTHE